MMMKQGIFYVWMICLMLPVVAQAQKNTANRIWYTTPADASAKDNPNGWVSDTAWLKALPVGNGHIGAMVFGDVNKERIQLNEMTLWSGSMDEGDNPDAPKHLGKIRELLFQGKYKEATELTNKTQITKNKGSGHGNGANVPFGCFQTLGDLWLDFNSTQPYTAYHRELDLVNGIAMSRFTQGGVTFTREVFASHPARALVIRLTASKPGSISFNVSIDRPERFSVSTQGNALVMEGVMNDGRGNDGMRYKTNVSPILSGGTVRATGNSLEIKKADAVTLIVTAKTNYRQQYPEFINPDYENELAAVTRKATAQSYAALKQAHIADFSGFMKRVQFTLDGATNDVPTNELLHKNFRTKNEQILYPLYFQFGRYLLLSSSREGGLPANLQGIWANKIQTPWNGDYHTDINVQMNYWPAEVANLPESHLPLMDLIASMQEPGKKTARIQYGMNGWALHPITNIWGYTSPGESASWGMHIGGGAWIMQHVWEHYNFTRDGAFLRKAYPMLKEASLFYLDWLVPDPKTGKLVSGPSPSPENTFKATDGSKAQISMGPSHDQQVIFNLFENILASAKILKLKDEEFLAKVAAAKANLARPAIGPDGRLLEWAEPFEEAEPRHRHLSHLFAFYPANEITMQKAPDLAAAVKKSLEARGDGGVGWTFAWKIALWARLHDGDRALSILNNQLRPTDDTGTKMDNGGGTYYNLFDAGPPFQIDGNFGVIAGMAEMLLQSHEDFIELLPALPAAWKSGSIKGLVARGNFVVDMEWKDGKLKKASVLSRSGVPCKLRYNGKTVDIPVKRGQKLAVEKYFL